MKKSVLVLLVGACAGSASAQQLVDIAIKGRIGDSDSWSSIINATPGSTVQIGIFMSGDGYYGFGGGTMRLTATGVTGATAVFADGTSTGRVAPFNFGAATNQIFTTADGFRIDAASDAANNSTSAGMTFFQRDPASAGPTFSTANPALVFRFDITFSASGSGEAMILTLDQLARGVVGVFFDGAMTRPTLMGATLSGAVIHVPAPGSVAMFAGALVLGRRRRF